MIYKFIIPTRFSLKNDMFLYSNCPWISLQTLMNVYWPIPVVTEHSVSTQMAPTSVCVLRAGRESTVLKVRLGTSHSAILQGYLGRISSLREGIKLKDALKLHGITFTKIPFLAHLS